MSDTNIRQRVESYLALRSTLGYTVSSYDRSLLQGFAEVIGQHGRPITAEIALNWACNSKSIAAATRYYRLIRLRSFLTYLRAFWPETEVPDCALVPMVHRPNPYIYSEEQIVALMRAARMLKGGDFGRRVYSDQPLRPYTQETLIGLLASTGLRIGEALRLDLDDARLHDAYPHLLIRQTKFRKSRIVPLHPSVAEMLQSYLHRRRELGYDGFTPAFFVSERGDRPIRQTISCTWRALLSQAGVGPTEDGRRPTIHAMRHTFAVRRLVEWHRHGLNVTALIPHLSVYLGHVSPQSTYWYLTATPELLSLAAKSFELYAISGGTQ